METDDEGNLVSYEEYSPFGSTTYMAMGLKIRAPSRYRYAAYRRDSGTELYYCRARFYAPWICRWISADPLGSVDGPNLYAYCQDDPVNNRDPTGTCKKAISVAVGQAASNNSSPSSMNSSQTSIQIAPLANTNITQVDATVTQVNPNPPDVAITVASVNGNNSTNTFPAPVNDNNITNAAVAPVNGTNNTNAAPALVNGNYNNQQATCWTKAEEWATAPRTYQEAIIGIARGPVLVSMQKSAVVPHCPHWVVLRCQLPILVLVAMPSYETKVGRWG
ncbi:tRNA nuclease WapA [Colletotrichum liriopes]|uniref:tRNA nuclease WapA n=1 Tax=Colletotrichum liriopes TaxID=708192 RepID=A0AA37LXU2_9PEZI|nr:tRNA nuclease WapA [Colletotrichum liriopes]